MTVQTITMRAPRPHDGAGFVNEGSDIPRMRPRKGRGATDRALSKLLCEAMEDLSRTNCTFWACNGPTKPKHMATCVKCWAMRNVGIVLATLDARGSKRSEGQLDG